MNTGWFLILAVGLFLVLMGLEVYAYYLKRHVTISELSRIHPLLRGLILLAILLFAGWWALHSLAWART